jgi:hypothetical protein
MTIRLAETFLVVATALLAGCASVPMASPDADTAAKAFQADAATASIYVYRNESMGAAIKMPVLIDGMSVGDTASKTYIFKKVSPGSHVITSKTENDSTLTVDTTAGNNYFIWQEVKMGLWTARSELHLVDEAKGRAGVAECKLVQ